MVSPRLTHRSGSLRTPAKRSTHQPFRRRALSTGLTQFTKNRGPICAANRKGQFMLSLIQNLKSDESGVILSAEIVLILTIGVLGMIVGLTSLQNAVLGEMNDLAGAFRSLNQSYSTPSFRGCWKNCALTSFTMGSCYIDRYEACYTDAELCLNGPTGYYGTESNNSYGCPVGPGSCSTTVPGVGPACNQFVPPSPTTPPVTDQATPQKAEALPASPPADATK